MLKRINAANVCTAISGTSMIAAAGFLEGGNYIAVVVCMVLFAGFAHLAVREDGLGGE